MKIPVWVPFTLGVIAFSWFVGGLADGSFILLILSLALGLLTVWLGSKIDDPIRDARKWFDEDRMAEWQAEHDREMERTKPARLAMECRISELQAEHRARMNRE
jgi:hypothetical protein